jgi:hypothetical protein
MKLQQTRLCIYPKDVQCTTNKSEHYGPILLNKVKEHFEKQKHQFVTV